MVDLKVVADKLKVQSLRKVVSPTAATAPGHQISSVEELHARHHHTFKNNNTIKSITFVSEAVLGVTKENPKSMVLKKIDGVGLYGCRTRCTFIFS